MPRFGALILNPEATKILLVEGHDYKQFDFPKGKLEDGESKIECAIWETQEEIDFDISEKIDASNYLKITTSDGTDHTLFVILDVEESTVFKTNTKSEIWSIAWYPVSDLVKGLLKKQSDKKFRYISLFMYLILQAIQNTNDHMSTTFTREIWFCDSTSDKKSNFYA